MPSQENLAMFLNAMDSIARDIKLNDLLALQGQRNGNERFAYFSNAVKSVESIFQNGLSQEIRFKLQFIYKVHCSGREPEHHKWTATTEKETFSNIYYSIYGRELDWDLIAVNNPGRNAVWNQPIPRY